MEMVSNSLLLLLLGEAGVVRCAALCLPLRRESYTILDTVPQSSRGTFQISDDHQMDPPSGFSMRRSRLASRWSHSTPVGFLFFFLC